MCICHQKSNIHFLVFIHGRNQMMVTLARRHTQYLNSAEISSTIQMFSSVQFSSVQLLSHVRLFVTPRIAARQDSLSITNSRSSLRLASIESVMPSSHLILGHPLLLLPLIPPSIKVFSNENHLVSKYSLSFYFFQGTI